MNSISNATLPFVLFCGILTMCISLIIHSFFLSLTLQTQIKFMKSYPNAIGFSLIMPSILLSTFLFVVSSVIQILIWAFLLMFFGSFDNINDALYFSSTTYTTLGTGTHVLVPPFRLLEPMEAATGMLVAGLNTAVLFSILRKVAKKHSRFDDFLN